MDQRSDGLDIAIVGLAGRFPGARNVADFWQNLCGGVESIHFFSDEELDALGVPPQTRRDPNFVKARAMLDDVEWFDAAFFGYTPAEAEIMDPQHRVLLECAWHALEDAGYDPERYPGAIGVYAGATVSTYLLLNLLSNPDRVQSLGALQLHMGNAADFLTTRLSYKLNLKGPSFMVESACSTSLVAVHVACQSLLNEECDLALAGGVSINLKQLSGYHYLDGGMDSPDGRCRAFDAGAQGTIFGSGAGLVVLKRLADARADRDHIYAVIKGSAINNDGALKVGYTAPSVEGQARVISEALAASGVDAETVGYVETHGTGTALGDPIEVQALTKAFRGYTGAKRFCALGSVKTNVGHLEAAAGVTSLIKTALALSERVLPPSLNFERPNPDIDFENSPFFVNTQRVDWQTNGRPRRAGVSSFGFGGTNAHAVLEEAPRPAATSPSRPWQLLLLSAKTEAALEQATDHLAAHLRRHPDLGLADVAYTLQLGRQGFIRRRMLVCQDGAEAVAALEARDAQRLFTGAQSARPRPVAFLFPGQGAQHPNMGRDLYQTEGVFREQVDRCAELLRPHLGLDLRNVLYPDPDQLAQAAEQLNQTAWAQPALFVVEYALAQLWQSWGVRPQALIGHSLGEYVAACLAGVFTLEDALRLVALRGRLMQSLPPGAMLSVSLSESELRPWLNGKLSLAASNMPDLSVVSGSHEAIAEFEQQLLERAVAFRRLHTSHAFHSKMMDPILDAFTAEVSRVKLSPPALPYLSNVSGTWITPEQAVDPAYWAGHLRKPVRFAEGLQTLLQEPGRILLEVGPGQTLTQLARRHPAVRAEHLILPSLHPPQVSQPDLSLVLTALGQLWLTGAPVDWKMFYAHEQRRRVSLPAYPFDRQRYWVEAQNQAMGVRPVPIAGGKRPDLANWFYARLWERSHPVEKKSSQQATGVAGQSSWLVFNDEGGLGDELVAKLRSGSRYVIQVLIGKQFCKVEDGVYRLNPDRRDDYRALLAELHSAGQLPNQMAHLWNVTPPAPSAVDAETFARAQALGFYSLLFLVQAWEEIQPATPMRLSVIANGLHDLTGAETLQPEKATLLGMCQVVPQEHPNIACRCIDVVFSDVAHAAATGLVDHLLAELGREATEAFVAYRGFQRWQPRYEPLQLEEDAGSIQALREKGVYLITGGLEGIGYTLAEYLARTVQAKLILTGSVALPDRTGGAIYKVQALEALGAEVLVDAVDVTQVDPLRALIERGRERFGTLHGVIHAAEAAGERSFKFIHETDAATAGWHFEPKVYGLIGLERAVRDLPLDFCVLGASLATVVGGLGYAAYAAANHFVNAFARWHNQRSAQLWVSVNWDAWQLGEAAQLIALSSELTQLAMTPAEGGEALRRILTLQAVDQLVVSTEALELRIARGVRKASVAKDPLPQRTAEQPAGLQPRPKLQNLYVAPKNDRERRVAEVWQRALGFERVGVTDNFFDLGGDSFAAMHVIAQLKKEMNVELPAVSLYEGLTVRSVCELLEQNGGPPAEDAALQGEARDEKISRRRQYQQQQRLRSRSSSQVEGH